VNDSLKVVIVSDRLSPISGQLHLKLVDFSGKVVWENKSEVQVPVNSSATYFGASLKDFLSGKNSKEIVLKAELIENEKPVANNVFYFLPFKELKVPTPKVEFTVSPAQGGFEIGLSTDKLAKNVFLSMDGEEGFFSDNYFDLLPGEKVSIRLDTKISEEKLKEILSIRTLEGAF
jgi:beta-mannosidase